MADNWDRCQAFGNTGVVVSANQGAKGTDPFEEPDGGRRREVRMLSHSGETWDLVGFQKTCRRVRRPLILASP